MFQSGQISNISESETESIYISSVCLIVEVWEQTISVINIGSYMSCILI